MPTSEDLEQFIDYIIAHRTDDWPMDQTLEDFRKKVEEWNKNENVK